MWSYCVHNYSIGFKRERNQQPMRTIHHMVLLDPIRVVRSHQVQQCPIENWLKVHKCFIISNNVNKWWHKRSMSFQSNMSLCIVNNRPSVELISTLSRFIQMIPTMKHLKVEIILFMNALAWHLWVTEINPFLLLKKPCFSRRARWKYEIRSLPSTILHCSHHQQAHIRQPAVIFLNYQHHHLQKNSLLKLNRYLQ